MRFNGLAILFFLVMGTSALADPVAHYAAEGNALDSSGNGNDGQAFNGAAYAPGYLGLAFSLDGVDDFVELNTNPALGNGVTALSVEAWINPRHLPTGTTQFIVSAEDGGSFQEYSLFSLQLTNVAQAVNYIGPVRGLNAIFGIRAQGQPSVHAAIGLADAPYWADYWHGLAISNNPAQIAANQWAHLVGVYTGSETLLYINGELVATSSNQPDGANRSVSGPLVNTTIPRRIGRPAYNADPTYGTFDGLIDEVKIYDHALSAADVLDHYLNSTPSPSCSDDLAAAEAEVAQLTFDLATANNEIVAQQSVIVGLHQEVQALGDDILALDNQVITLLAEVDQLTLQNGQLTVLNQSLQSDISETMSALLEIARLIATPQGKRTSSSNYVGSMGSHLNAIIDMLVSPPGQGKNNGK